MPLFHYDSYQNSELLIWEISEELHFFRDRLIEQKIPVANGDQIKLYEKSLQWFASRYALSLLYPSPFVYSVGRKPYLFKGPYLSFSHSGRFAGAILSQKNTGLDIQEFNAKLILIKDKFTNNREIEVMNQRDLVSALSLIWSAKEAIFKLYGSKVPFLDIQIESYDLDRNWILAKLVRNDIIHTHNLKAYLTNEMSLAYVIE